MPVGFNTPGAATQRGGFLKGLDGFWEGLGAQNGSKIETFFGYAFRDFNFG